MKPPAASDSVHTPLLQIAGQSDSPAPDAPSHLRGGAAPAKTSAAPLAYSNEKALWHFDRMAALRDGHLVVPTQVQLILSDLCDQSCHFCNYRMETGTSVEQFRGPKGEINPNRRISASKAYEILGSCMEMGVKAIQFTGGGEPLVHPEIIKIIGHAQDLGLETALVTNLWHLKDGWRDVLPRLSWLRVSVDAASAETYAKIRSTPPHAFGEVIANIHAVAQQLQWSGSKCLFGAGFVVTPENWRDLPAAAAILSGAGVSYMRLSAMFSTEGAKPYETIHEDIIQRINQAKALETESFKVVNLYGDRIEDLVAQAPDYEFCGYQQFNVYIGGNLKVYRCCTTAYTAHGEVGDLTRQTFTEWLIGTQRQDNVRGFDARTCHLCQFNGKNRAINAVLETPAPLHVNFV